MATLNNDGISIKSSSTIYAPRGRAGEYAPLAANLYRGCGHGCAYCYVPEMKYLKLSRAEFDAGAFPRPDFMKLLRRDARNYQSFGITEQVMLSFTSDPYHLGDTSMTRETLEVLIEHGMGFCTLTKGGTRALRDLDLFRPERDAFASTLTALDAAFSRKWERNAADPDDRIAAIKAFHEAGIFTWVSLEPTLSAEASIALVEATHEFVDLFKVGKTNYIELPEPIDWQDYTLRMIDTCQRLDAAHFIKRDLQEHLPPGYNNPMRVAQHH